VCSSDLVLRQVTATIDGGRMQGRIAGPDGDSTFTAERKGDAPPVGGAAPVTGDELSNAMRQLGEQVDECLRGNRFRCRALRPAFPFSFPAQGLEARSWCVRELGVSWCRGWPSVSCWC